MFVEERHQEILRLLNENEKVKVKELGKRFEVTEDCIRKDLASMEAKNLLKRTYGGAVLPDTLHPGHTNIVSIRKDKNIKEKRMIAKKAVELIHDGDMIFLDTSTTNIELAREIIERRLEVTVVSCMLDIAEVFTATKNVKFILLGGEFNRSQNGFLGELVLQMMENFKTRSSSEILEKRSVASMKKTWEEPPAQEILFLFGFRKAWLPELFL